jgi:hypothetical protein
MIIGTRSGAPFFNIEISGLSGTGTQSYAPLKRIRDYVEAQFDNLCSSRYQVFSTGIRVDLYGSLFLMSITRVALWVQEAISLKLHRRSTLLPLFGSETKHSFSCAAV